MQVEDSSDDLSDSLLSKIDTDSNIKPLTTRKWKYRSIDN